MATQEPELVNTLEDGLRIIRFNRPKRKNALSTELIYGFQEALEKSAEDPDTKIVVVTGTGDYFSSGNDMANYSKGPVGSMSSGSMEMPSTDEGKIAFLRKSGLDGFENFVASIIKFPKPIVAVVNGPAVGVAVTMLPLFDVVYASDRATFQTPFVSLALSPEGCSSYLFPRIMGHGKAAEMLMFSRKITATDAYQHGLVTEVFPDDSLQQVWPRIREWAKLPPISMVNAKSAIKQLNTDMLLKVNHMEVDRLALQTTGEEFLEALMKFLTRKSKL
ncbi:Enoyl-CoA delta isomerase 2, mitochondrial [Halocaridina rubra]|uniref:Enoyl-CoA delta isomerase 2, mitochondrial n=1 Tax=Halocaridina rubra TaxID=373956 RepID=A0AAN8WPX3_HALRR